jgi:phage head maturation protease
LAVDSLLDVSPTTFPAYPDTDVKVAQRSYDAWRSASADVQRRQIDRVLQARGKAASLREYLKTHGR